MYILSNTEADQLDFENQERLFDIISDITYQSGSQENLTDNLTKLRNAAVKSGQRDLFDKAMKKTREIVESDDGFISSGLVLKYKYTFDDFAYTEAPYMEVFSQPTAFLQKRAVEAVAANAKETGFGNFKTMYKTFAASMRKINESPAGSIAINPTDFPNQPLELECGEWNCDYSGVSRTTSMYTEIACHHPVMPVERLTNVDTYAEKLKIAYYRDGFWREIISGKRDLFDAAKVIKLADYGVSVTSKSAKLLSEFLCFMEANNSEVLPCRECVSRLGYVGDGSRFSPFDNSLVFDGEADFGMIFNSIKSSGTFEKWLDIAVSCRNDSITAQIMLASSFASVLIKRIGGLPFFVHLWGGTGTGKSVALMLAASVWGNPEIGQYIQTFNATQVGMEKLAAFCNNIPLCVDEAQLLAKDNSGKVKFDVYQLSQGVGRTRGTKTGGIDSTPTWSLCVLSTGEASIVPPSAGGGAVNRVIDVECTTGKNVISDGKRKSRLLKRDYGFAGKMFIEALKQLPDEEPDNIYDSYYAELMKSDTTEKQAMAGAMILTADELADRFVLKTGKHLSVAELSDFLQTKASVSIGVRGYGYMCDWVAMNTNRFKSEADNNGECYGVIVEGWAYINRAVFRKTAMAAGYDERALLSWLKSEGLILTRGRNYTRGKRINGVNTECVAMKLPELNCDAEYDEEGLL